MRKLITIGLISIFALSFFAGVMIDQAAARPGPLPTPCTYRCINGDWHKCCYYQFGDTWEEVCVWHQSLCTFPIYD